MGSLTPPRIRHLNHGLLMARWVLPVDQPPIAHGFIQIERGRIHAIGHVQDLSAEDQAAYKEDNTRLITPGMINAHTHLELTYPELIPAPDGMGPWLEAVVALSRQLEQLDAQQTRIRQGITAMLQTGTTYCHDISREGTSIPLLAEAGISAQVALEFFCPDYTRWLLQPLADRWQAAMMQAAGFDIQLGLSPHSLYNVHPLAWHDALTTLKPAFIHTHLAESLDELAWLQGDLNQGISRLHQQLMGKTFNCPTSQSSSNNKPFVRYLTETRLADYPTRFAHGVWLSQQEAADLEAMEWQVLHCPRSNQHLSGKTLDATFWPQLPLGTDSTLSCPDLDLRAEARTAAAIHGWTARRALRACTLEGATALNVASMRGSLSPGKQAELAVWQMEETDFPEIGWLHQAQLDYVNLCSRAGI